jgi:hypothetical protein
MARQHDSPLPKLKRIAETYRAIDGINYIFATLGY